MFIWFSDIYFSSCCSQQLIPCVVYCYIYNILIWLLFLKVLCNLYKNMVFLLVWEVACVIIGMWAKIVNIISFYGTDYVAMVLMFLWSGGFILGTGLSFGSHLLWIQQVEPDLRLLGASLTGADVRNRSGECWPLLVVI